MTIERIANILKEIVEVAIEEEQLDSLLSKNVIPINSDNAKE